MTWLEIKAELFTMIYISTVKATLRFWEQVRLKRFKNLKEAIHIFSSGSDWLCWGSVYNLPYHRDQSDFLVCCSQVALSQNHTYVCVDPCKPKLGEDKLKLGHTFTEHWPFCFSKNWNRYVAVKVFFSRAKMIHGMYCSAKKTKKINK